MRKIDHISRRWLGLSLLLFGLLSGVRSRADSTWVYTVQISAVVQASPPKITLNWEPDEYGVNSYLLYRKSKASTSWGTGTPLPGSALSYTDTNVVIGTSYEYQIVKFATLGYTSFGYIFTGIAVPMTESRGTAILVVATESTAALSTEVARLESDLAGDGWKVIRHDVSTSDTPAAVRTLITNDYYADPQNVNTVFLLGHVPILQSGNENYDGHLARPMPADAFYADVDGNWPTNTALSPGFLPSDAELMVGRVDLANMPGAGALVPWPNETELLRNYLNKDHKWRHHQIPVPRLALMGNRRGDENGEATAASGYRNFEPCVGPGNTIEADTADVAFATNRWIAMLSSNKYLWAYGCGAGQATACSGLGFGDGSFNDVRSIDIVGQDAHAPFVMLFGSWFGNWDDTDDLLRSVLATRTMGLASCMAGRPHWFFHHVGLGETLGYSTRLTLNNSTLYQHGTNAMTRAVYIALMGDPTLRMEPISPSTNLTGFQTNSMVILNWSASPDSVEGYYVYRAPSPKGPFARISPSLITGTQFSDSSPAASVNTYMVRAVKLQVNPSGSYYNPSQGVFTDIDVVPPNPRLMVNWAGRNLKLSWNSITGAVYRVQGRSESFTGAWSDIGTPIIATNNMTSWTDNGPLTTGRNFFRVVSP